MVIENGADVNARGTLDITPLHLAAATGDEAVVRYLLNQGANPPVFGSDYAPTCPADGAVSEKHNDIAEILWAAMREQKKSRPID